MVTTELKVDGFHCGSCKVLVEDIASDFSGITSCVVDVKTGRVVVVHDAKFDISPFVKEIEAVGKYKVKVVGKK